MNLTFPEGVRTYLKNLAGRVKQVEDAGIIDPIAIASAVLTDNYQGCFWDIKAFTVPGVPREMPELLEASGLIHKQKGSTRGDAKRTYLIHFLAPLAAYNNNSPFLHSTFNIFGLDPGINVTRLHSLYPRELRPSAWFSLLGDVLQDRMLGSVDEDEYRADLLGLRAVRLYKDFPRNWRLSGLLNNASENVDSVWGEEYKNIVEYQIAERFIRPVIGHKVVNFLSRYTPIFV